VCVQFFFVEKGGLERVKRKTNWWGKGKQGKGTAEGGGGHRLNDQVSIYMVGF